MQVTVDEFNACLKRLRESLESFLTDHIESFQNKFSMMPSRVEVIGGSHRLLLFRTAIEKMVAEKIKEVGMESALEGSASASATRWVSSSTRTAAFSRR